MEKPSPFAIAISRLTSYDRLADAMAKQKITDGFKWESSP